jgi:ribosomal-protein-alanine N-acetyltransferase
MIRWAIRRDLNEILDIEFLSNKNPWTADDFIDALKIRNCIGLVFENEDKILGYILYELHKEHFKIIKMAVHPNHRRQEIGTNLIYYLLNKPRRKNVFCMVEDSNLGAHLFFQKLGFRAAFIRNHFVDSDGYLFKRKLFSQSEPKNRISSYLEPIG